MCKFCPNSANPIKLRFRSVEKSIQDLLTIMKAKWLQIDFVFLTNPIFMSKKHSNEQLLTILKKINYPYQFHIEERIDTFSFTNIKKFKHLIRHIGIGFESASIHSLERMGKISIKNNKLLQNYLLNAEKIAYFSKEEQIQIVFYNIIEYPGESKSSVQDHYDFYFKKESNQKNLVEKSNLYLHFNLFYLYPGTQSYDEIELYEKFYGTIFHHKYWWKEFNKHQQFLACYIDSDKDCTFQEVLSYIQKFYKTAIKHSYRNRIKKYRNYRNIKKNEKFFIIKKIYSKGMKKII